MTPPDKSNYTDDLMATSLEEPEVACYGRRSYRLITASDGGFRISGSLGKRSGRRRSTRPGLRAE